MIHHMPHSPLNTPHLLRRGLAGLAAGLVLTVSATGIQTTYIDVAATVAATPTPQVTFTWDTQKTGVVLGISRRVMGVTGGAATWVLRGSATYPTASFTDAITTGTIYEYKIRRPYVDSTAVEVAGFSSVTLNAPVVHDRGKILLVVDQSQAAALASELTLLEEDLTGDGWTVQRINSARDDAATPGAPAALRAAIQAAYQADSTHIKAVYLFGHLPVPMSGWDAPDGHANRQQYADGFYGDMDGTWTDTSNFGTGNVPGDSIYDPNYFPSKVELMTGRVDFADLTAYHKSEVEYLRDYIHKSHAFRLARRTEVGRRGLWNSSYLWQERNWIGTLFGAANMTYAPFKPTLTTTPHLFGIDFGNANGADPDYTDSPNKLIFGINFGSYKLSWAYANNAMRGLLAQPDWGLTCAWGARPAWFFHHMGVGLPVGYSALKTMNNWSGDPDYFPTGDYSFQAGNVQETLLGDPTLRLHPVAPPENLTVAKPGASAVLTWQPSTDASVSGYYVYSATNRLGPYTLLTATPLAVTTFTDGATPTGDVFYQVRALKSETTACAVYANTSQGAFAKLKANGTANAAPTAQASSIIATGNQLTSVVLAGTDPDGDPLVPIVLTNPTLGELRWTGSQVQYQPKAGYAGSDSIRYVMSDGVTTSAPATISITSTPAGVVKLAASTLKVSRAVGTAQIAVERSGGVTGAITVSYTCANSSAVAGTHFTAPTNILNWADGETGIKYIAVPITNSVTPQLPRQFRISLSSVTNNATIGLYNNTAVLIEDPAATLPGPWTQAMVNTITNSSPAVQAEGALGSVTMGGSGLNAVQTWEGGQFIYQSRAGDGCLTAYVQAPSPAQSGARFAVMVRDTLVNTSIMASTVTSGDSSFGSKFIYRTVASANSVVTGSAPTQIAPNWIRITRAGNTFTSESSPNGTTWTALGSATVALPATAQWGLFHLSADPVAPNVYGDFQLATFQSASLGNAPATATPGSFAHTSPTSTSVNLTWGASAYAAGYRIERRDENGDFALLTDIPSGTTLSYTDNTVAGASAYQYRILAYNGSGVSALSSVLGVATPDPLVTTTLTPEADACVRYDSPATQLGSANTLTISGSDFATSSLTPVAKSWLRFDLSGLPVLNSATLKLSFLAARDVDVINQYFYGSLYLLADASDTWNEMTINWNNAPQNDFLGKGLRPAGIYLADFSLDPSVDTMPSPGTVYPISLGAGTLSSNKGVNGKITIAFTPYEWADSGALDFASRENTTQPGPTLEVAYYNPLRRPGFVAVTPVADHSMSLTWTDNSSDETSFQIERRAANGSWAALASCAANATSYIDTTALAGVIYEYRVRSAGVAGNSSWASPVTRPIAHASQGAITSAIWSADSLVFKRAESTSERAYVPTGFTYTLPTTTLVTGQTLSAMIRGNYSGWLGTKITVGATAISVRELGRWVVAGNTGSHKLKLVLATTPAADVPGGSATVNTAGAAVGFKYAALASPVTLAANTAYYLVSQELNGGDQFYEGDTAMVSTGAAAISQAVWSGNGTSYSVSYLVGNSYGPLSLTYSAVPVPWVTSHSMTLLRNDFSGWLGMEITTGSTPLTVVELGRWVVPGNSGSHSVKLVNAGSGADLGAVSVATAGATDGQFKYSSLASSITLAPNTRYYVLSQEVAGGDQWYDFSMAAAGTATGYQYWLVANGLPMDASGSGGATATPANDSLPNLVKYSLGLAPTTSGHGGRLSNGKTTVNGSAYLTFTYTRPEPAPAGVSYAIDATSELAAAGWSSSGLTQISSTLTNGLRTITLRDNVPMSGGGKRFMRLRITQP